jgi:dTDP-4-amino-4,6-dideoxygalactose transaminase
MADVIDMQMPLFKVFMGPGVVDAVADVLTSGYVTEGPKVKEFETALAEFLGTKVITLNSGTSALTLALRLAGVGPGDEVITTPMTCQATNTPILNLGAVPVWADIDSRTGLIDPQSILHKLTHKTKAVMAVDWGGAPCDYDAIYNLLPSNVKLIADAAHAFGSTYKSRVVGDLADFTCFSFQAIKHLTSVDGGALTALHEEDLTRGRLLRWFGIDREAEVKEFRGEVDVQEAGYKMHMNDLNATIGLENLKHTPEILALHRANAAVLDHNLNWDLYTSTDPAYQHNSAHWLYTVLLPDSQARKRFKEHMSGKGIQVSQVHWRNDKLTAFRQFAANLPGVDSFSARMVCVPIHWGSDSHRVLKAMNEFRN